MEGKDAQEPPERVEALEPQVRRAEEENPKRRYRYGFIVLEMFFRRRIGVDEGLIGAISAIGMTHEYVKTYLFEDNATETVGDPNNRSFLGL